MDTISDSNQGNMGQYNTLRRKYTSAPQIEATSRRMGGKDDGGDADAANANTSQLIPVTYKISPWRIRKRIPEENPRQPDTKMAHMKTEKEQ